MKNTKKIIASLLLGMTVVGCTSSPFLDETQQEILRKVAGNRVTLSFSGGYENAERKRALIGETDDFEIVNEVK